MTKKEYILDSLVDDDEVTTQILEYFKMFGINISEKELEEILNEMLNEGLIIINTRWKNEKNEYPYSLTDKGRNLWQSIK